MNSYIAIFRVLWRMKRIEISVNSTWKQLMFLSRKLSKKSKIASVVHYCSIIRQSLLYFLSTLQHYIMFDVLETSWEILLAKIEELRNTSSDLDDLIQIHQTYLHNIEEKIFLRETKEQQLRASIILPQDASPQQQYRKWTNKDVRSLIDKMLNLIVQFLAVQDMIYTSIMDTSDINKSKLLDEEETREEETRDESDEMSDSLKHYSNKLLHIHKEYQHLFKELLVVCVQLPQDECIKPLIVLKPFNQVI